MSWRGPLVAIGCVAVVTAAGGIALDATVGLPWAERAPSPRPAPVTPAAPPAPDWAPAAEVLAAPGPAQATPGAPAMADVLAGPLAAPALGGRVGVSVVDLSTGATVYESGSTTPQTPASTLKILTAAAALQVLGPDHRFITRVVTAAAGLDSSTGEITIVGGGDPTLTAGETAGGTGLSELADATARALTDAGVTSVNVTFDDSLFTGPSVDPDWSPGYVPFNVVSPISALSADVAETRPREPALEAAATFADLLEERGVSVGSAPARTVVPDDATEIASVTSEPVSAVVESILATSDNDGAEVLARHVALGSGLPGTSENASIAVVQTLTSLGIDMSPAVVLDGSGLARGSAVPASVVAGTLTLAADPSQPQLRPVITGLPVAGFSGTLADRFDGSAGSGAGIVRAKTGTLTGVSSLAGVVTTAGGAGYAFAILADDVPETTAAREALDDVAASIARCGCA